MVVRLELIDNFLNLFIPLSRDRRVCNLQDYPSKAPGSGLQVLGLAARFELIDLDSSWREHVSVIDSDSDRFT